MKINITCYLEIGLAISYHLIKQKNLVIIDNYNKKFVYNDNFGSVVLRNEAIIVIEPKDWVKPYQLKRDNLIVSFVKMLNQDETFS